MKNVIGSLLVAFVLFMGNGAARAEKCDLGVEVPVSIRETRYPVFIAFAAPDVQCFGMYENGKIATRLVPIYEKDWNGNYVAVGWEERRLYGWASTGRRGHETPLTPTWQGPHRVNRAIRNHWSKEFSAWMPHTWFFTTRGHAVHGGEVRQPTRSHGCIRVSLAAAHGIYNGFRHEEVRIIVTWDRASLASDWPGFAESEDRQVAERPPQRTFRWGGVNFDQDMFWHEEE